MVTVRVPLASRPVRYGVVVAVAVFILVASVVEPGAATESQGPFGLVGMDKWSHAVAYATLTATLAYAAASEDWDRLAAVACLAVAFGIGVELVQWPISYRTASAADVLADAVGACLLALYWWWSRRFVRFVPIGDEAAGVE